jgi:hypothetical protein
MNKKDTTPELIERKPQKKTFRSSAAFGKRIELYVVGLMLKEGLDVYLPLVDDDAIDAVIKRPDGKFVEVQIKARSNDVKFGNAGLFAALTHELRKNYWFVFYSERMDTIWIMNSKEFLAESRQNQAGRHAGVRTIKFNGRKAGVEYTLERYERYVANDFRRLLKNAR